MKEVSPLSAASVARLRSWSFALACWMPAVRPETVALAAFENKARGTPEESCDGGARAARSTRAFFSGDPPCRAPGLGCPRQLCAVCCTPLESLPATLPQFEQTHFLLLYPEPHSHPAGGWPLGADDVLPRAALARVFLGVRSLTFSKMV